MRSALLIACLLAQDPAEDFARAVSEMKAKRWEEGRAILDRLVRARPDDHEARNNLAVCLIKLRRYGEAEFHLLRVLRAAPDKAGSHLNLGVARQGNSQTDLALKDTDRAVDMGKAQRPPTPDQTAAALFNRGWLLDELERYEDAVAAYKEALGLRPEYPRAWLGLAVAYAKMGRYKDAREALREAKSRERLDPEIAPLIERNGIVIAEIETEIAPAPSRIAIPSPDPAPAAAPRRTFFADGMIGVTGLWDRSRGWSVFGYALLHCVLLGAALALLGSRQRGASALFGGAAVLLFLTSWGFAGWGKWGGLLLAAAVSVAAAELMRARARAAPVPAAPTHIAWECADCGRKLRAAAEMAGKSIRCPQCGCVKRL
ncbi:MAG: tetratricopeptide repeat protein [Planctomycetes bacterium]|nr:tetratricopeptide repeat protein [Planctomycetota bacterium]